MKFDIAIKLFIDYCIEKDLSNDTLKAYAIDLEQFNIFLRGKNIDVIDEISKDMLKVYFAQISKLSNSTIYRKMASLRAFFNYHEDVDNIGLTPFHKLNLIPSVKTNIPDTLTLTQIDRLLRYAYSILNNTVDSNSFTYFENLRNVVVLELLITTGIRTSELCNVKGTDFSDDYSFLNIEERRSKRIIPISSIETREILKQYCECKDYTTGEYFFVNRLGKKISTQSIRLMTKKMADGARLNSLVTPKTLRQTFTKLMLELGVPLKSLSDILGNKQLETTQSYSGTTKPTIMVGSNPRNLISIK